MQLFKLFKNWKLSNITKAWKSSILALVLLVLLVLGVMYGKVESADIAMILPPILALFPSDTMRETEKDNLNNDADEN